MTTTVTLPPAMRQRIAAVARRARLLRAVRGLSLCVLVLALTGGAAALADYFLDLPAATRQIVFSSWAGLGLVTLLGAVVVPLCRRLRPAALAALIEEKYPNLGERLTSAVELADAGQVHGSPVLAALLIEDTQERTRPLDFRQAVPARRTGRMVVAASLAVAALVAPAVVWPDESRALADRFLRPWNVAASEAPYAIEATGDAFAARGRPLTLTAHLVQHNPLVPLPNTANLLVTDSSGKETRQPMEKDQDGAFKLDFKVLGDFRYRVEAGMATSDTHTVTAITPVELAADSPTLVVTPPAYARAAIDVETFHGLVDLSALQHSEVRFDLRFTRPAVKARLEWITQEIKSGPEGTKTTPKVASHELPLVKGDQAATFTLPAAQTGQYRLVLEAEHGITTERDGATITARPDLPPAVLKFSGKEDLRAVLPYDRLPFELKVSDDVGVATVNLEYKVNGGEVANQSLALDSANSREAVARMLFAVAGKAKENDEISYRFRVTDNLPKEYRGPHTIFYPADRWLRLRVAKAGSAVKDDEIVAQRDEINRRLEAIKAAVLKEQRGVYKVQQESRPQDALTPDQVEDVRGMARDNQDTQKALRELSQVAALTPALAPLADRAEEVADQEMQQARESLDKSAAPKQKSEKRDREFNHADRQLNEALSRLDEMKKANEQIAQDRLAVAKLERLGDREKSLADKTAELAAKHPERDPGVKEAQEKVRREQAEVAAELNKLMEENPLIKKALDEARGEDLRQAAQKARELARQERELADAGREAEKRRNAEHLAELAKKQQELADKATRLADESRMPTRVAMTTPIKPETPQKAAEALKEGEAETAMQHQARTAADLDRLARDLDRAAALSEDPRMAARQLARLEEGLRQRVQKEVDRKDTDTPLAERLKPLAAEQEAIERAAERLSVPPTAQAQREQKEAAEKTAQAARAMEQEPRQAPARLAEARKALDNLATDIPTLQRRQQQAQGEVARLRQRQDNLAREVEQIKKDTPDAERRLAEAARKQAAIAEEMGRVDPAGKDERHERTQAALERAVADLAQRRRDDVPASQEEARRQLARLEDSLAGKVPEDDKARELARQQRQVAADAARAAETPSAAPRQKADLQRRQAEIAEQARQLVAPEAPQRRAEAVEATRQAARPDVDPTSPEGRRQAEQAARKLEELARQMSGQESDAARAQRLAQRQAEAARQAEEQARRAPTAAPTEEARRQQQEIAQEARQVRGGEEARAEKARAAEALARAEKAGTLQDRAQAQRQAAEAMRELADRLGRRDAAAAERSPQEAARELARQQRELAQATERAQQEAARQGGEAGKQAMQRAAQELGRRQEELSRQAAQMPARGAEQPTQQTREAMRQAQQALARNDASAARQRQNEAAAALERAAERSPTTAQRPQTGEGQQSLPSRQQAEEARQLAREQRDLRAAVERAMSEQARTAETPRESPMGDLARRQQEVARAAADLDRQVARQQGENAPSRQQSREASQAAGKAAEQAQAGAMQQARQAGEKAAEQLRQLAQALGKAGDAKQGEQAGQLARQQEALNRQMGEAPRDRAAQQARQQELRRQTGELAQNLERLGQQMSKPSQAQEGAQQAAQSASQAGKAMEQAAQNQQGSPSSQQAAQARQQQQEAAQSLEQAARQAEQAANQLSGNPSQQAQGGKEPSPMPGQSQEGNQPGQGQSPGQALQQAQGQMSQVQSQLGQNQSSSAQSAMKDAAEKLGQAAKSLAQSSSSQQQPGKPGQPNPNTVGKNGTSGGGEPDLSAFGLDKTKFAGKTWGELPGELRTKLVQDMKAKYGDDYARMIKLYFEQIAAGSREGRRPQDGLQPPAR